MPSRETVDKVLAAIKRGDAAAYFFDRLSSPEWIRPLAERGLFDSPPAAISSEGGYVQFPVWAASRYLARVASQDPAAVLEVAATIPDVENPRVYEDLVDAALSMPASMAAEIVPRVREWIKAPYQLLLPSKAGALLSHLSRGGEGDAALTLGRGLLAVHSEQRTLPEEVDTEDLRLPPEAIPRFDVWDYEQILTTNVPDLVEATGMEGLALLRSLLGAAIRTSERTPENGLEDFSWIWRPAIEDHEQNHDRTPKDFLVTALRDAAVGVVSSGRVPLPDVVSALEGGRRYVFQRLALHLLTLFPEEDPELLRGRILDESLFDLSQVSHEFGRVLNTGFSKLREGDQRAILVRIETGPDLTWLREHIVEEQGQEPEEAEVRLREDRWRLEKLGLIGRDSLPAEWQQRFDELVGRLGPPEGEEFPFFSQTWVGDASPKTSTELEEMDVPEVVALLREWVPPGDPREASREGLGITLASAAKARPGSFSEQATRFEGLDPIYVRELLRGLEEAVKAGAEIRWTPVIDLARWVVEQPREIPGRVERYSDLDPGWTWTRSAIASLLEAGFISDAAAIPLELREAVWSVLEPLTRDPDPDESADADGLRAAELSLNSIRGKAMHDVFLYCRWIKAGFGEGRAEEPSLADIVEAKQVFESALDPGAERHSAIRAIFGWRFQLLLWLDRQWTTEHLDAIFSRRGDRFDHLGQSAWDAYVRMSRLFLGALDILRSQYEVAVHALQPAPRPLTHDDPEIGLAHHLVTFLWHGKVDLQDSLLERFFASASQELRGEAVKYVGRSLRDTQDDIPSNVLERLMNLWESRLTAARRGAREGGFLPELEAFGWWFISGKLPDDWLLENLLAAVSISKRVQLAKPVVERLSALAPDSPQLAIRIIQLMISGDLQGWEVYAWRRELRDIVAAAQTSEDTAAHAVARDVISELVVRGYPEFRELVT